MTKLIRMTFFGPHARLRDGWWVVIFLASLLAALAPVLLWSAHAGRQVSLFEQVLLILIVTWACQRARGQRLRNVIGKLDRRWPIEFAIGAAAGAAMLLLPAFVLLVSGAIQWRLAPAPLATLSSAAAGMLLVAIAEELLFRGFLFQRLLAAIGVWPAQIAIAMLFLLTHLQNPGMTGSTRWIAGMNIFAASLLFGFAYLRTRSLALPIGLHWMANVVQGPILGLGVSGNSGTGALQPSFNSNSQWLTGGSFGLEASIPGTIFVVAAVLLMMHHARYAFSYSPFLRFRRPAQIPPPAG